MARDRKLQKTVMKEDKKSRNPFHGFLGRLKAKRESDVPSQTASRKVELVHGQSENDVAKDIPRQTTTAAQHEIPASNPAPQKSFWEQAAEKLNPEVRHALDETRGSSMLFGHDRNDDSKDIRDASSLPEMVEREAQRRLEDMEHRQWALPIGIAGKTINLRTLLGKFIAFAKVVKDKGDAFIGLDPTGYAKLAWLPFSLFVDLSAIELEQHQAALDALSEISSLIYRYAQVETIYHERNKKEPKFEECLVELYSAVLECEVALLHHFCRHGFLRFLRAIPVLDGWQDRVTSINHLDQRCQLLVDIHVADDIFNTRRDVEELVEAKRRKEINDILEWIIDHNPLVQRKLVLEKLGKTYSNIGKWLFEHEAFKSWLESDSVDSPRSQYGLQLLWLHGPVGCGKSCLTTRIIEYFLEQASAPKHHDEQVSYFYCVKTHGSGSKPLDVLQSMVRQLAWSRKDSHIEKCIKDTWASRQSSKTDRLSLDDCKTLLLQLIPRFRKTILIIDALDECDNPLVFLETLKDLSGSLQEREVSLSVFVSSRDDVQFAVTTTLSDYLAINITSSATEPDLRRYIERRVDEECKYFPQVTKKEDSSILQRLVDELTERGQLAFRWTELQLALFFPSGRPFNPVHIKKRLEGLKERSGLLDLNNTYKEIYEHNISESSTRKDDLHFLLKWALACTVNIHIKLLTETIKFNLEQQGETTGHIDHIYILDLASNLLIIDQDDTVQFAHISVKEYFQVTTDFANEFSKPETNNQVAETCLQYLLSSYENFPKYSPYDLMYVEANLSYYALTRWALHYAGSGDTQETTRSSTVYFEKLMPGAFAGEEFMAWVLTSIDWYGFHIDNVRDALSTPPCPLFLSCIWGFKKIVHDTIEHEPDLLKALNQDGRNGLHLAAYYNQSDIVKALLRTDIDVNQADTARGRTALHQAILCGNTDVVRILLSEREDVNVDIKDEDGYSAIHHAVSLGQVEITRILLDRRKDLDIHAATYVDWNSESPGRTPLHLAIAKGHLDVARILLDKRDDILINLDCVDGPPLCIAAGLGYVDIIDMLFRKRNNISVDQKDNFGRTALHMACMNGHVGVVRALLQKDSKFPVNNVNNYGRSALHYAAKSGHGEVIQALFDGRDDLDVNIQDHDGYTALHLAAKSNHATVIETLLRKRETIQVNITQSEGRTALQLASEAQNAEAITALLSNSGSIDTDIQDSDGNTALHLACQGWRLEVVKALLDGCKDLKLNTRNKKGKTALRLAVENRHLSIVEQLAVRPDIDPNIADDDGLTVLHMAALLGSVQMLRCVVGCAGRIDINARSKREETALHLTLDYHSPYYYHDKRWEWRSNSADCVRVLLDNDIDIFSQDEMGKTALYLAAEEGHSEAVMMFLDKYQDATLNEKDKDGWTILHWAVYHNDETVVERVIGQWPDIVNIADKEGQTALLVAAAKERWLLVQILLDGCPHLEIDAVNTADGWTALHLAAQYENTDAIRELLRRQPKLMSILDNKGRTALHIACSRGQAENVRTLLEEQPTIDINAVDKENGYTALHFAVEKKSARAVLVLLDARPDIDINIADLNGRTAAQVAVTESATGTLQVLLGKRKDIDINHADKEGRTALHLSAQKFRSGLVLMLLENAAGFAINTKDKYGQTALYGMLENGLFRQVGRKWVNETGLVVRVLLEKYKDLFEINERDIHGRTVSHLAAHFGRLDALRAIVEMCNDVEFDLTDKDGRTVLHYAASRGHMDDIVTSLEKRGEFEAEDEDEDIWEALDDSDSSEGSESDSDEQGDVQNDDEWNGTEHCVKVLSLLLDTCNHRIINAQDKQGLTVFHLASIAGDGAIVTKLLSDERDIDVNVKDVYGWTALHMAVFHRCSRVVETLLTKCSLVDINIQDQRGQTPLHLAASRGRLKIVKALLENGRNIDLDLKDEEQRTALDLAEEGNHAQVVDILKAAIGHGLVE